jgi:hypothetical protein
VLHIVAMTPAQPEQLLLGNERKHELPLPDAATSDVKQLMRTEDSGSFWLVGEESGGN